MSPRTRSSILPLVLVSFLFACSPPPPGEVVIITNPTPPPPIPTFFELEPNDDAYQAQYIGAIAGGDVLAIQGFTSDCCLDPYDGFAFYALEPVELVISLYAEDPYADLDFGIYDPLEDRMVATFESASHPEVGVFALGLPADFQIVVYSWYGSSAYSLEIEVFSLAPTQGLSLTEGSEGGAFQVEVPPSAAERQRFDLYRDPLRESSESVRRAISR